MLEFLNKALNSVMTLGGEFESSKLRKAIVSAALQRVRPIIMTTCSTIAGLMPIMFLVSTGSEGNATCLQHL